MLRIQIKTAAILFLFALVIAPGCRFPFGKKAPELQTAHSPQIDSVSANLENPSTEIGHTEFELDQSALAPPLTSLSELPKNFSEVSLDEVINMALQDAKILRGLGARVVENPLGAAGIYDPAIQATDPNFGIEGALSQFDALFAYSLNYQNNDDVFNNAILGGGANEVQQDLFTNNFSVSKIAASGTQYAFRGNIVHDNNNQPNNLFNHAWNTVVEAEVRQPLLQGRGVLFNRIAGPNGTPGFRFSSGVVISRINNDISKSQFERSVREFVNEIIAAYWQLYFAYRNFDAARSARNGALQTWNIVKARNEGDLVGGEADKESEAREQYFIFQSQLISALNGDPGAGTVGVLQAEADLRRLMNLPQSDGKLLRPADTPGQAKSVYDWSSLATQAMSQRVELIEQRLRIRQRELELFAAKKFLLPRLDAVAVFRNNGFGNDLIGGGSARFASAAKDAFSRDHNEWELGLQLNVPVGRRQAAAAVRNAELQLCREKAVFNEQSQQILFDLGASVRQVDQAFTVVELARNRLQAAQSTVESRMAAFKADRVTFEQLIDSQRRLAEAEVSYYRELVDYELAKETVSRESGNLLNLLMNYNVLLQE